jgi:hypothetical protein
VSRGMRVALLTGLWLTPLSLLLRAFHGSWRSVWAPLGIPAEELPFPDLRGITGGLVSLAQHHNPLISNPGDPWNRVMNYPRIWLPLFATFGIRDGDVPIVGVVFCALYLICISLLILRTKRPLDGVILLVASLSLAPLFALELGNTDLFIFALVFLGCVAPAKTVRLAALCAATLLKIYPLAAMAMNAIYPPKKQRLASVFLLVLVLGSFAWQWSDMNAIRLSTPTSNRMSYGVLSMKAQVEEEWGTQGGVRDAVGWTVIMACWLAGALAVASAWTNRSSLDESILHSREGRLFGVFGAIYVFSFAIGSNWDYRLMFLLPTLPFSLELARHPAHRRWAIAYTAAVVLAENPFDNRYSHGTAISHLVTFFLFLVILATLTEQCRSLLLEGRRDSGNALLVQYGENCGAD